LKKIDILEMVPGKKKSVIIRAPLLSYSGYGVHSRQIFNWLIKREDFNVRTQIVQWGNTSWMINPKMENGLVEEIMKRSGNGDGTSDISFQVQLPDEWDPELAKVNFGVTAGVETLTCNPAWIESINRMDAIIVPSNHTKKCLTNTGNIRVPIFVVPESFIEEVCDEEIPPLDIEIDTSFNILLFGQLTGNSPNNDRKNIFNTLKWLCETFKDDKDVGIILKTNTGRGTKIDRMLTRRSIESIIKTARVGSFPKIHMLHGNMTAREVAGLYRRKDVKCLTSLTRGEGFGLPVLEAAASGLPVIITDWSGHLDFMNRGRFIKIDFDLVEIDSSRVDNRIFMAGSKWAEPIEKDFKEKILKFRNKNEIPKKWANDLKGVVREEFSHASICEKYDEVLRRTIGI
jgi:glycosyltransferase involved in cell wall biosynthesis